jgi:hypothetical protein
MKKIARVVLLACLSAASVWAQAVSQIQGIVSDATGAAIPGAEVKATETDTSFTRAVMSGTDGVYVLQSLPIGPYRIEVSKQGFATYVQTGITLQVNTNPTVDITLKVGAVSDQVQVEANAALVDTQGTSVGSVIENRRILEIPLNGRNPVELIQLAGASVPAGINGTAGMPGGLNISVGGGLPSGVGYFLDGTLYNNPFDAVNLPFPFPDALQEFKLETSTLTAQNGLHAAGAVNAVVKSGTNDYHGDLFEFFRNGDMNARNAFAAKRDTLKRNQYGGTLGAPIIKNKAFFFVGYQGTKTRSDPADRTGFVPTPAMLAGDFSQCSTFPTNIIDPSTGLAFPNKQIPVSRFSSQSLAITKLLPTSTDPCGRTPFGPVQKINEYQVLGRVDFQISDKQSIFARYMATTYLLPSAYGFSKNLLDSPTGGLDDLAQSVMFGHTYLFTPTTVNTFRVAANRVAVHRFNDDYFSGCDIGVKMYCYVPHQTVVTVTGGPSIGVGTAIQAIFIPTYYTLSDDLSMVRGNHQFGFGYSTFKYQHSQYANVFSAASFAFGGLAASSPASPNLGTGLGMADFLLGQLSSMTQGAPNTTFTNKWYAGLYAQDTWKVSRKLTVNYGVRWEPFLPEGINNGAIYNYSYANFLKGVRSTVFKNAPPGLLYAGDPGFNGKIGVDRRYNQFAPRLGVSFDPKGDGRTVIRASYGTSFDYPNIQIMSTPTTAPPFGNTITPNGPLNFADPYAKVAGGNPFPSTFGADVPFVKNGSYVAQQPDAKATTVYSWNFAIQHQFARDWVASATYLGNQSIHIWGTKQLNPAVVVPCPNGQISSCNTTANTNTRRIAYLANPTDGQYLGPVDVFDDGGTGSYHAMLLAVQKRLARGVSFNANYTWSHCIADINAGSWVGSVGGGLNIADNRRFDRGNCQTQTGTGANNSLDRRHLVNITAVLQSPRFTNNALLRIIASSWTLSNSYRYQSASFVTVSTGVDYALNGSSVERPNQLLANPLCDNPRPTCWINPAAFSSTVPAGTFGNLGRSNVPAPTFFEFDTALTRAFPIRENKVFEIRGEAFNLTNSFRSGPVTSARNSTQFGQILSSLDPRIIQLAAKFTF